MTPDPTAEWWITSDVATYLGAAISTVSNYRRRRQMPPADDQQGRTPMWRPATIIAWRPRPGYELPPPAAPAINTTADLRLWLDGYDNGAGTVLHALADLNRAGVPPERVAAIIDALAVRHAAGRATTSPTTATPR